MKKITIPARSNETDKQIDKKLKDRFAILKIMTEAAISGDVKSLIISGPAGLGKSFTVEEAIEKWDSSGENHTIVKGYVKATGLYKTLWENKEKGNIVVFDDSHWSSGMRRAWREICTQKGIVFSINFFKLGLIIFDSKQSKPTDDHYQLFLSL